MMMVGNGDYYLLGGVLVIIGNVVMIDWATSAVQYTNQSPLGKILGFSKLMRKLPPSVECVSRARVQVSTPILPIHLIKERSAHINARAIGTRHNNYY